MSLKALTIYQKPRDDKFNFGYRRINILAAFVNTIYLLFSFIFDFMENLHHVIEHWEEESHETDVAGTHSHNSMNLNNAHDDIAHIKEMNFYIALFSLLRLLVIGAYLFVETKILPVEDYMQENWFNWPKPNNKTALK